MTTLTSNPVQIDERFGVPRSAQGEETLRVLRQAVAEALDRKRRLGQYAVFWQDGQAVRVEAKDLPALL